MKHKLEWMQETIVEEVTNITEDTITQEDLEFLSEEYFNLLTENGELVPHIVWRGKLLCNKVKFESIRIYLATRAGRTIVVEGKDGPVTKKLPIRYKKVLDLYTELHSGAHVAKLSDEEILNMPIWTRMTKHDISLAPCVWNAKDEIDYFVSYGKITRLDVLKDTLKLLSVEEDSLCIRNTVKQLFEAAGLSCDVDSKVSYEKMKSEEETEKTSED